MNTKDNNHNQIKNQQCFSCGSTSYTISLMIREEFSCQWIECNGCLMNASLDVWNKMAEKYKGVVGRQSNEGSESSQGNNNQTDLEQMW